MYVYIGMYKKKEREKTNIIYRFHLPIMATFLLIDSKIHTHVNWQEY